MRTGSPEDDRIRQLESDLWMARMTILELMGPELEKILLPTKIDSRRGVHLWFRDAMEKVLDYADVETVVDGFSGLRYAACPLCAAEARNPCRAAAGFTYPEGLRRHLHGSHNSAQCPVTRAALALALDRQGRPGAWRR